MKGNRHGKSRICSDAQLTLVDAVIERYVTFLPEIFM